MKILHIVPGLDDPTCGIAVAAKMIATGQRNRGCDVRVHQSSTRADYEALMKDADEVWVHSMWTPGVLLACRMALRLSKPLVRMPHGCTDPTKVRHRLWKKFLLIPIERHLFRKSARIISTAKRETHWIKTFVGGGCPVIEETSLWTGSCQGESRPGGYAHVKLLYVGRLHPLKGVSYLLQALPQGIPLTVIGKDEGEGARLREIAASRGLTVDFRGVVSEEEKLAAYDACDVLCLPTLSENFGLVVAEALERGKRVVVTDGAPAWEPPPEAAEVEKRGGRWWDRLSYVRGFRDGTDEERVKLLKEALSF